MSTTSVMACCHSLKSQNPHHLPDAHCSEGLVSKSATRTCFSEQPPFAVSPSLFVLQPGEATVVEVVFFPTTADKSCQAFTVVCDNCQVKDILIEGEGQLIALELASVSGEMEPPVVGEVHDLTAEHFVRFSPCNPHSVQQKKLIIRNNVHLELPFQWQIMKPNLYPLLPGEPLEPSHIQSHLATDDVLQVGPITGFLSPCQDHIRMDWETYNIDQNDRKLVDVVVAYGDAFPVKDADGNEVIGGALQLSDGNIKTVWERNQTPFSKGSTASLQSMSVGEEEEYRTEDGYEKEQTCLYPFPARKKLFSVHIQPHVGNLSDYPYCITPQQIVIPAKSSGTIYVSFTPLTLSGSACETRCVGLALGFLSLDSELAACVPSKVIRAQGLDLEPVRVDLLAAVKPAVLFVQMEDDEGVLEFHASAGDLLKAQSLKEVVVQEFDVTQTLKLKNTLEVPLHFRLGTQPPFIVLKPQRQAQTSPSSNPPTGDSSSLVLQPKDSMQVKVAFHCSLSLLDHVGQTDEDSPLGAMLIHSASGQRKLRFQQNLLIHYSNNSLQTVPLCAHLDLPTLGLSHDSVNFGLCYVGQTQTAEVNLYSHGAQIYWKSIIELDEGDSHVFSVTPDSGLLRFKELSVSSCSESLQIRFTPSEDREFRAMVLIQCALEKTPITLQLEGTGSFDEMYRFN